SSSTSPFRPAQAGTEPDRCRSRAQREPTMRLVSTPTRTRVLWSGPTATPAFVSPSYPPLACPKRRLATQRASDRAVALDDHGLGHRGGVAIETSRGLLVACLRVTGRHSHQGSPCPPIPLPNGARRS